VHCTKISAEFEFGVMPTGCTPQKCGAGLRRWENQRRLSSYDLVIYAKVRATKVKAKANVED